MSWNDAWIEFILIQKGWALHIIKGPNEEIINIADNTTAFASFIDRSPEHRLYELTDSRSDSLEFQILEIQDRF